jgi:uncharacterized protein (TIGR00725 family)
MFVALGRDVPLAARDAAERRLRIGVMGPGATDAETDRLAEEVGGLIARAGALLVCGGLGGAMEAAARGARAAGGSVLGILPGMCEEDANPWVDIPVLTGMGHARNAVNVLTCHAVIAVRGSYGTLSEMALALKAGRPVVALQSWRLDAIGCDDALFQTAETPGEAVEKALAAARQPDVRRGR